MKNGKIWTIVSLIVLILQAAAESFLAAIILRLNLLPSKYTLVLALVLAFLLLLTASLLFIRGKKPVSLARRIIAIILALIIVFGCALLAKLAADAYNTLQAAIDNAPAASELNMYVLVRKDDPAKSLADTKNYTFGIIENYDVLHTQQAIAAIGEVIGTGPVIAQYEKSSDLADALFDKRLDALILNGAAIALLLEEEAYEDFMVRARILHAIPLADLEPTEETTETTVVEERDITNRPFIVYISGSDTRNTKLRISRSDVNILVIVNPVTKQVLLLNTPRDYYVPNPVGNGALDKLTHCGLYGTSCSMQALGDLYGLTVDYYAQINFTGFETLIDSVGGITVYSPQSFKANTTTYIKKGENTLNGKQALDFARERYHVSGGDNGRGKNQMRVIKALIEKMTSGTTIISNYSKILDSLKGMFKTDFSMDDVSLLVKMQLNDMATWNVQTFAVTGTGASKTNYSSPGHRAYVMIPHDNVVAYASELVQRVLAGDVLTEADMKVPKN